MTAYNPLRLPRSTALATPAATDPPAPRTLARANWEAPVKTRSDTAHAWMTEKPAATAAAPNEAP
jgi:hypothetical protein